MALPDSGFGISVRPICRRPGKLGELSQACISAQADQTMRTQFSVPSEFAAFC